MFKDRLAEVLREERLTQREFAERVGVNGSVVSAWLRGSEPRLSRYRALVTQFPGLREERETEAAT